MLDGLLKMGGPVPVYACKHALVCVCVCVCIYIYICVCVCVPPRLIARAKRLCLVHCRISKRPIPHV